MISRKTAQLNQSIAHTWAHQHESFGSNKPGNFYFRDRTIYSYGEHFPMAVLHRNKDRELTGKVLFTTDKYWMSNHLGYSTFTEQHKHTVKLAISHLDIIYCKEPLEADRGTHQENLLDFERTAKDIAKEITERTRKPEKYLDQIREQLDRFTKYCETFNLGPKETAERLKFRYLFISSKDKAVNTFAEARAKAEQEKQEREARAKEQEKKDRKSDLAMLRKWRAFGKVEMSPRFKTDMGTFLRYSVINGEVQTSKGIRIPLDVANRFYTWFYKTLKGGGCTGDCQHEILGYHVQTANENGLRVGCHDISIDEITALAKMLKWTEPAVAIERCKLIKAGKAISLN